MSDVYYSPEKFGLETVAELDLAQESYSFDLLVVWKQTATGRLLFGTDSGCSCPAPFEGVGLEDLIEFSWAGIQSVIDEEYNTVIATEEAAFKDAIRAAGG